MGFVPQQCVFINILQLLLIDLLRDDNMWSMSSVLYFLFMATQIEIFIVNEKQILQKERRKSSDHISL